MKLLGCLFQIAVVASYVLAYRNFPFWLFLVMLTPPCVSILSSYVAVKCYNGSKLAFAFILLWFVSYIACHIIYWK